MKNLVRRGQIVTDLTKPRMLLPKPKWGVAKKHSFTTWPPKVSRAAPQVTIQSESEGNTENGRFQICFRNSWSFSSPFPLPTG